MIKLKPEFIQAAADLEKQSQYCISEELKKARFIKSKSKINKLSFDQSLILIKNQKTYGNLIPMIARTSPRIFYNGKVQLNKRYSAPRQIIQRRQIKQQSIYQKVHEHFKTKKMKKSYNFEGINSFWVFKKQNQKKEQKQRKSIQIQSVEISKNTNSTQSAFLNILKWAKLPPDINSPISRGLMKNYLAGIYNQKFAFRFVQFYQLKSFTNYKQFCYLADTMKTLPHRESNLIAFFLYDQNSDGFICQSDIFAVLQQQISQKIEMDLLKIAQFVKTNAAYNAYELDIEYQIQNLILKDNLLTVKDYHMYNKKVEQPYLKARGKKDTVFSNSFIVLDHRQNIRSTRKEMELKKNLYNEMIGSILKTPVKEASIKLDEFTLNFGLFSQIFIKRSEYFKNFVETIFGI